MSDECMVTVPCLVRMGMCTISDPRVLTAVSQGQTLGETIAVFFNL